VKRKITASERTWDPSVTSVAETKLKSRLECKPVYVKTKLKLCSVPVGCGSGIWRNVLLPCCQQSIEPALVVPLIKVIRSSQNKKSLSLLET
jgi:hypothetical protein